MAFLPLADTGDLWVLLLIVSVILVGVSERRRRRVLPNPERRKQAHRHRRTLTSQVGDPLTIFLAILLGIALLTPLVLTIPRSLDPLVRRWLSVVGTVGPVLIAGILVVRALGGGKRCYQRLLDANLLLCPECGYSLVGHAEGGRCPECGYEFTPESLRELWLDVLRLSGWGITLACHRTTGPSKDDLPDDCHWKAEGLRVRVVPADGDACSATIA